MSNRFFTKVPENSWEYRRIILGFADIWNGIVILATLGRYRSTWPGKILLKILENMCEE